nr:uncharacterized protein LOC117273613 [Nicotiana tomentosiformis]
MASSSSKEESLCFPCSLQSAKSKCQSECTLGRFFTRSEQKHFYELCEFFGSQETLKDKLDEIADDRKQEWIQNRLFEITFHNKDAVGGCAREIKDLKIQAEDWKARADKLTENAVTEHFRI